MSVDACEHNPRSEGESPLPCGYVIGGRIRIEHLIGRGATASVYKGFHTALGVEVAVKVIRPFLLESTSARERFVREAKAISLLDHANLAKLLAFDRDQTVGDYMVLELVDGKPPGLYSTFMEGYPAVLDKLGDSRKADLIRSNFP